jgi:hypothetical protein
MKRSVLLILAIFMLAGCSSFSRSEFLQHESMYKNWDHMKFSWFGYRNPSEEDVKKSIEQEWWGIDVPHIPGQ